LTQDAPESVKGFEMGKTYQLRDGFGLSARVIYIGKEGEEDYALVCIWLSGWDDPLERVPLSDLIPDDEAMVSPPMAIAERVDAWRAWREIRADLQGDSNDG